MNKLFHILIIILAINFIGVRCNKDNTTPKNSITYQNQVYNIDKGTLENYGNLHGSGINLDLTLLSASFTIHETNGQIDSISGTGNGIYFEMYTNSTTALAVGDYTYDKDSTGNPGTFDFANAILNYNTTTNQGINQDIAGGVVSVKSAGTVYTITFNCTTKSGQGITGYYRGALKYYDNTVTTKSATVKNSWWRRMKLAK